MFEISKKKKKIFLKRYKNCFDESRRGRVAETNVTIYLGFLSYISLFAYNYLPIVHALFVLPCNSFGTRRTNNW